MSTKDKPTPTPADPPPQHCWSLKIVINAEDLATVIDQLNACVDWAGVQTGSSVTYSGSGNGGRNSECVLIQNIGQTPEAYRDALQAWARRFVADDRAITDTDTGTNTESKP